MNLSQLETWKTTEIASMNVLITNAITGGTITGWTGLETLACNQVTDFINGLTYNLIPSGLDEVIKTNLSSVYSYISVKYMTLIDETPEKFPITSLIASGGVYTNPDDFRNVMSSYKELPTLNLSYFDFVTNVGVTVEMAASFVTLKTDIESTQVANDIAFWNSLPATVMNISKDKLLYLMFATPKTKSVSINAKSFLLNDMHFKDVINGAGLQSKFIDLFPELAQ